MNGPWSGAAWVAAQAAWGRLGGGIVAATAGRAGAGLVPGSAGAVGDGQGHGQGASLAATAQAAAGEALALGLAARPALPGTGWPAGSLVAAVAELAGPAVLAARAGPCLAGTGIREVARLFSPPTTSIRLGSPVATRLGLFSGIDSEQT